MRTTCTSGASIHKRPGSSSTSSTRDLRCSRCCRESVSAQDVGKVLHDIEPPFVHYDLLKKALVHYRELALEPELTRLPPLPAKSVKPGEPYAGAAEAAPPADGARRSTCSARSGRTERFDSGCRAGAGSEEFSDASRAGHGRSARCRHVCRPHEAAARTCATDRADVGALALAATAPRQPADHGQYPAFSAARVQHRRRPGK